MTTSTVEPIAPTRGPRPAVRVTQTTMITQARAIAVTERVTVLPSCSPMMAVTGRYCWYEVPKSPATSPRR